MRKLCPNFDFEDGLDTVLEVPIPEEVFSSNKSSHRAWKTMKSWMKPERTPPSMTALFGRKDAEIQLLLGVVGAPLIPFPVKNDHDFNISKNFKDQPIEASMAKYIVKQYVAAAGGEKALNSIESMYAMGKVKMAASEFYSGEGPNNKVVKVRNMKYGGGEIGGFVLWQKRPELWCLELVVSGCKITAGSDGKVAWRQTPWHHSHASRGPPRPLRRFLQGIDPRSTANLFSDSICVGEKTIDGKDCFILKLEAESSTLKSRSSSNVDIIRHTICGYFSQKTGLLVHLEDSHLIRIKSTGNDNVYWETTMESSIQDYRTVEGISIAHAGKTWVSLFKFGENSDWSSRTMMEEVWAIEEVDFNIKGLSLDCFLPPSDMKKEEEEGSGILMSNARLPYKIRAAPPRINGSNKVAAVDFYYSESDETDDDDEEEEEEEDDFL